jgi:hypothetical protein
MTLPGDYWASYEHRVSTLTEYLEAVQTISAYQAATQTRFAWRGVADANYPLHSRLSRAYADVYGTSIPQERQLRAFEEQIIQEARDWGLDWRSSAGRLTALDLLAALQHFGAPTRLLDFTLNPLVALWFAVESDEVGEGRVFAVDISERLVTRVDARRADPWWFRIDPVAVSPWTTESWAWLPPPLEVRIARQEACFLMGGIPTTRPARNVRVAGKWRPLVASEVRECMSLPFSLISYRQAVAARQNRQLAGRPPEVRAFTLLISGKPTLRADLENAFGYSRQSLFPDLPGFAEYGQSFRVR